MKIAPMGPGHARRGHARVPRTLAHNKGEGHAAQESVNHRRRGFHTPELEVPTPTIVTRALGGRVYGWGADNCPTSYLTTPRRWSFLSGSKQVGDVGKSQHVAGSTKGELNGAVCEQHRLRYNRTDCYLGCLFERSELWSSETYYVFDLLGFFLIKGLWLLKAGLRERPAIGQEYSN